MNSLNTHKKAATAIDLEVPAVVKIVENQKANKNAIESDNPDIGTHSEQMANLDAELAIDLNATANPDQNHRLFWDGNVFVSLEHSSTDCSYLLDNFSADVRESFKNAALQYKVDGQAGLSKLIDILSSLRTAAKKNPTNIIDANWVSKCLESRSFRTRKFPALLFLKYWKDRDPSNAAVVTPDALNLLAQAKAAPQSSRNVASDDPEKSWLTDDEYADILQTTWSHYDATGDDQSALIRLLSLQYARRPAQLRGLKFCDLKSGIEKSISELTENEIHFPSVKEKFVETEFRGGKFEAHPIADHLWSMLKIQRRKIQSCFEDALGYSLTEEQILSLPIFTNERRILRACSIIKDVLKSSPLEHLDDELFHIAPMEIIRTISFERDLSLHSRSRWQSIRIPTLPLSSRTGRPIFLHAIRLRHTRIRQLARQGVPRPILSHWLGHTSEESLDAYYDDPAEMARKIDEQLSTMLTPIAQAFTGIIIATDAEATHPDDPFKSLDLANDGRLHHVGRCGKFSFCATTSIPVPCYRCKYFEPLVDAPHEEVLDALNYRQVQENAVVMKSGSMRNLLIPIDLSDDIRAVERCIALCKAQKAKNAESTGNTENTAKTKRPKKVEDGNM